MGVSAQIGIAVVTTAVGVSQQNKQRKAQEESDAVGSAQQAIQNNRAIRQSIAANKIQRAQLISAGQAQAGGFGASSSVTGALGSASSQLAANIGFARTIQASNTAINNQRSIANQAQFVGSVAGAIGALPQQLGFGLQQAVRGAAAGPKKPPGTPAKTPADLEFARLQARGGRQFGTF